MIFPKMTQQQSYQLLLQSNARWLLRECNSCPGMLSVSALSQHNPSDLSKAMTRRFVCTNRGWKVVPKGQSTQAKKEMRYAVYAVNGDRFIGGLIHALEQQGLNDHGLLTPEKLLANAQGHHSEDESPRLEM